MRYDKSTICKCITYEREKKGWTKKRLGEELGITGKQVGSYEKGELIPPIDVLVNLCNIFDVDLGYLLGEESYEDQTKLYTSIHHNLGLDINSIQTIANVNNCLGDDNSRQNGLMLIKTLNRLLSSPLFVELLNQVAKLEQFELEKNDLIDFIHNKCTDEEIRIAVKLIKSHQDVEHENDIRYPHGVIEAYNSIQEYIDYCYQNEDRNDYLKYNISKKFNNLLDSEYPLIANLKNL